jgi:hypothetical protein
LLENISESDPQHDIKAANFGSGTSQHGWPIGDIANLTQAPQDDKRNGETQGTEVSGKPGFFKVILNSVL